MPANFMMHARAATVEPSKRWQQILAWTALGSALLLYPFLLFRYSRDNSATFDEGMHIAAGHRYWAQSRAGPCCGTAENSSRSIQARVTLGATYMLVGSAAVLLPVSCVGPHSISAQVRSPNRYGDGGRYTIPIRGTYATQEKPQALPRSHAQRKTSEAAVIALKGKPSLRWTHATGDKNQIRPSTAACSIPVASALSARLYSPLPQCGGTPRFSSAPA